MFPGLLRISGWLLLLSLVVSLIQGYFPGSPIVLSGILNTSAAFFLFHRLIRIQKFQVALLSVIGLMFIVLCGSEVLPMLSKALTTNHALIALIISVGFLRLIIKTGQAEETLPKGTKALWKTLIGAHLFGAVINLSVIVIFGDRFLKKGLLHKTHFMILSRTFGADAMWSPFFAAMGAALLYSGGAELLTLMLAGMFMACCSIVITGLHCLYVLDKQEEIFEGYPMHIKSLFIPAELCIFVFIAHYFFPDVSTLILVASVVMITVIVNLLSLYSPAKAAEVFIDHVENGIANSASELLLFLSAGLLAVGISFFTLSVDYHLPIEQFTGFHAAVTLLCMVLLAFIGLHPVVSISVLGGLLAPLSPDPNLLGLMFLFSWGISIVISPFSGISLLLQSRYSITATKLIVMNMGFTMIMLLMCSMMLILFSKSGWLL